MTDYTKYLPYFLRSVKHTVKPPGWRPPEAQSRTATKFLDVSKEPSLKRPIVDSKRAKAIHINMIKAFNLCRGDLVRVLYGRDAGNTGVIRKVIPEKNQLIVSGCNVIRSFRPSFAERQLNPGLPALVPVEAPIHVTNVAPLDPVTKKPTRIKRRYSMTGECVRISKQSGCAMPEPVMVEQSLGDKAQRSKAVIKGGFLRGAPIAERALDSWKNHQGHFESLSRMTSSK
jgi:large subunit ribosomal protein L24